jgi:hypothetical protein
MSQTPPYKGEQRRDGEKVKTCRIVGNYVVLYDFMRDGLKETRIVSRAVWLSYEPIQAPATPMEEAAHVG